MQAANKRDLPGHARAPAPWPPTLKRPEQRCLSATACLKNLAYIILSLLRRLGQESSQQVSSRDGRESRLRGHTFLKASRWLT